MNYDLVPMRDSTKHTVLFKSAWLVLGIFFVLLTLFPISIHADDATALPDRSAVLPALQKSAGKDWAVTTIPEGYLLTYAHPVLFYPSNGATPTAAQLTQGKTTSLCIKVIFGRPATQADLDKAKNPYSERQEAPMEDSVRQKLKTDHFYMCSPSTWANGPAYAVFIATNMPPDDSVYPSTASDSVDHILFDLGNLFHF